MDSGKQPEFSTAQKVYRPSPRRYLKKQVLASGVPVVFFGLMILMIPIFTQPEWKLFALIIDLFLFVPLEAYCVYYFLWLTHVRLVISGEGIGCSTFGYRIFTPWGNVARFGTRQQYIKTGRGPGWTIGISGLELHQPAPIYKARRLARYFFRAIQIERPSFFIPVRNVVENWQHGEVAEEIQRYAPWLR